MTATLGYERFNHPLNTTCAFPYAQLQSIYGKPYYKLYQLKLRKLINANPFRREDHAKSTKEKPMNDKRSSHEYLNRAVDDDHGKRATSVISIAKRRMKSSMTYTITSTEVSTSTTIAPTKSAVKTRQSSSLTKHPRIISAPTNQQRSARKKISIKLPSIGIEDTDEDLSKSNGCYMQAASSSQDNMEENNQPARQSTMSTIMLHLHSSTPADLSRWNLYQDFDEKISASVSPRVYRNYERIIL